MTGKILEEILASSENTAEIQSLFCSSCVLAERDSREMILFYFYFILTLI